MEPITTSAPRIEKTGVRTVDPDTLLQWLASGRRILVLDVREPDEVEKSDWLLPTARALPLHQLFVRRHELPLGKVEMVVTVSNKGVRSRAAAFTLALLGFPDVRSLAGGLEALAQRGTPRRG